MKKQTKLERYLSFHLAYLTGSKFANCPFCGDKPRELLNTDKEGKVRCINKACGLYNHFMSVKQWEERIASHTNTCDICGKQRDDDATIGSCNKCSLSACEDCVSEDGWCLECVYDFGKRG